MNFMAFRELFISSGCFNINQIYAILPQFERNNLSNWLKKGYILRLRRGLYTFADSTRISGISEYFAGQIYKPSYISLHYALSCYGLIPESVVQITSVTTLKTADFKNDFGDYRYKSIHERLMFGYSVKEITPSLSLFFATPEKALLDLLYLYPFYNSTSEIENLRLDEDLLHTAINWEMLVEMLQKFENKALERRIKLLQEAHAI